MAAENRSCRGAQPQGAPQALPASRPIRPPQANRSKNEVKSGYILFFLRDYPHEKTGFPENSFAQKLHKKFDSKERVPTIYVEKQGLTERKGRIPRGLVPLIWFLRNEFQHELGLRSDPAFA